ncbi:tetraspanin-33-like isoform X2 [Ranitomeya imitator]|uniref:tetraspanin-33-like isoform X2 n=1 Tax=Ranitomeya imitator TaxID=111125 RepID=UPI0037E855EC
MRTSQVVKYSLFISCYIFWVASGLLIAVGFYAKLCKETGVVDSLTADPAILLIVVGMLMFIITFFGCMGALRDVHLLLKIFAGLLIVVLILQLVAAVLGFIFSGMVLDKASSVMLRAIIYYREDLDLQNFIDYIQKKIVINTMCGYETQNLMSWQAEERIFIDGCLDKIVSWGRGNLLFLGYIALGLILLEIVVICLAVVLIHQINFIEDRRKSTAVVRTGSDSEEDMVPHVDQMHVEDWQDI